MDIEELRYNAELYRAQYNLGYCTREEAKKNILPYIEYLNNKAKEIAKKYNKRPKIISFSSYIR